MNGKSFALTSRGDRVSGVFYSDSDDVTRPLILLCAPDGAAAGAWIDACTASLGPGARLVGIDLPLCGARVSEKMSERAFQPGDPLAEQLRDEIDAQACADLHATLAALSDAEGLRPSALGLIGAGRGARLAERFCREEKELSAIVLERDEVSAELESVLGAQRLRLLDAKALASGPGAELVEFLRGRLDLERE